MNQHSDEDLGWLFKLLGNLVHTQYDEAANRDARRRISAFFREHLQGSPTPE